MNSFFKGAPPRKVMFLSQFREEPHHSQIIVPQMDNVMRRDARKKGFFRWSQGRLLRVPFDVVLIARTPRDFLGHARGESRELIESALRWAPSQGYTDVGLGSLVSSVTNGGRTLIPLARELELRLDHGDDMSTGLAARMAVSLQHFGFDLHHATVAVVGAVGVMGAGFARLLSQQIGRMVLVVRKPDERSYDLSIELKYPLDQDRFFGPQVQVVRSFDSLREAHLIYLAHSDLGSRLRPEHLRPGAIVLDACVPPGTHASDFAESDCHLVLSSGCGILPGWRSLGVDLGMGHTDMGEVVYGCMAGIGLAANYGLMLPRLGPVLPRYASRLLDKGALHGITHQPYEMFGRRVTPPELAAFIHTGRLPWKK